MPQNSPHLSHPKYRADIDGLRAIAVLAVVAFHAFPAWLKGGFIGVDVFFVISGYLISTIIFESLDKGVFSFSEFYARRIKRIFPALILVLITCFAFGWFALLADEYKQLGKHMAAGAGFVSNLMLWSESGYFDNAADTKPLLHLWSLGIEEQFYIVWPLLLWLAWKRNFNLFTITVLVAIASFVLNLKGVSKDQVAAFYSPQTRFWELFGGSLLAWGTLYQQSFFANLAKKVNQYLCILLYKDKRDANAQTLANLLAFVGLLLLAYGFWRINKDLIYPGKWALVPVVGTILLLMAGPKAWINRTLLSNKIFVGIGLISYPLYLWHWPLLSFARIVESGAPTLTIRILAIALSILLAWLTYLAIERPIRFGQIGKRSAVGILVLLMLGVGGAGYYVVYLQGIPERIPMQLKIAALGSDEFIRTPSPYIWRYHSCFLEHTDIDVSIGNECTEFSGVGKKVVVWGDSNAASLMMGLRSLQVKYSFSLSQYTGSSCMPGRDGNSVCDRVNKTAINKIQSLHPDIVILHAMYSESTNRLQELSKAISQLRKLKVPKIILLGPVPQWNGSLAQNTYIYFLRKRFSLDFSLPDYMNFGLAGEKFYPIDAELRDFSRQMRVEYISPIDFMCIDSGCKIFVDNQMIFTSMDRVHLTPEMSIELLNKIDNKFEIFR